MELRLPAMGAGKIGKAVYSGPGRGRIGYNEGQGGCAMIIGSGIVTEALRVRPFAWEDRDALYQLSCQPEITDVLPEWRMNPEQLDGFLRYVLSSYERADPDDVRYLLAIEHAADECLIGWCGVFPNDKLPPEKREIAYAVSKHYRNRGYATQAVRAVAAYTFEHTSLHEISAIVKPFNRQSGRVLEKAGFSYEGRRTLSDEEEYDTFAAARAIWIRPEKEEKGWKR